MSVPVLSSSPGRFRSSAKPSISGEIQGRPVYFYFFVKVLMMPYVGAVRMNGIMSVAVADMGLALGYGRDYP